MRTTTTTFSALSALGLILQLTPEIIATNSSCVGTINSVNDVTSAVACTTVNLGTFTVPAGQTLTLNLLTGTTVNMVGDISFGNVSWAGPLFSVSGKNITFNGNGYKFDGGGPFYWDGLGGNGGIVKPAPMMKIKISGTYSDVNVVNSPERAYSVSNPAALVMSNLVVDNSQGDVPNSQSNGLPAGHNTDGFDCSTTNLVIQNRQVNILIWFPRSQLTSARPHSLVHNQDDCIAINSGTNIVFQNNTCINGHGISIGSIGPNVLVSGIVFSGNTVINNDQAFRIKTDLVSSNSTVTNVTYTGNTATGIRQYGVIIDQSYPSTLKVPGNGTIISNINFLPPTTTIAVVSGADQIAINCAVGSCQGTWNWASLEVSGGIDGPMNNFTGIVGFSQ